MKNSICILNQIELFNFYIKIQLMGNSQEVPTYNEEVPNSKMEGFSPIYRKKGVKELKQTPEEQIKTIRDLLRIIKQRYGDKQGIGEIIVTKEQDANGEQAEVRTVRAHTYNQIYEKSYHLGRYLYSKQLFFVEELFHLKLIGIYSKNRLQWFLADWACILFGMTSVPLYDTLGVQNLTYCLNQTLMTTIFVSNSTVKTLLNLEDIGNLKLIISFDELDEQTKKLAKTRNLGYLYFQDILKEGSKLQNVNNDAIAIKPNDCYTFSYTSGTTGPPKGAMISHKNLLGCVATFKFHQDLKLKADDRYLSYLPLPHLMERGVSLAMFYSGAYVVISSGNMLKLKEDCKAIKVTFFISVPRIFNRIVQTVKSKFQSEGGIKGCFMNCGVSSKMNSARETGDYSHLFYDKFIFSHVRESFGGNIRLLATGSAPINPQVHAYMKAIMCCPFIQGYGQTESSTGALFTRAYDTTYGTLTQICTGLQVKLSDIPEMKYTSKDVNEEGRPTPRGQLWKRGPQVFIGYYKQPQVTKETITHDGWLKTGDIAQFNPVVKGFKIIDRKKNIFKLQQGEYLAPDRIESAYSKCSFVAESFLHGNSHQFYAVIVMTPNRLQLQKLAESKAIKGTFQQLCLNKEIRKLILTEMNNVGRKQGLNGFELAKNIYLEPKGFMFKNILTNTMKLIRFEARVAYKEEINQMYKEGDILK